MTVHYVLYEAHAAHMGYAATSVAFAISLFFMLVVERITSSTFVLLARLLWGAGSVPEGCLDEPMRTLAEQLKGSLLAATTTKGSSFAVSYLDMLARANEEAEESSVLKGYSSMQMLGAGVSFFTSVGGSLGGALVDGLTALSTYLAWVVVTTLFFSLLFIIQENYSEFLLEGVHQWNTAYGPLAYKLLFVPLQIVDVMFSSLVPIYNTGVWMIKLIVNNVILDTLMANTAVVQTFGLALARLCKHTALEMPPFVQAAAVPCDYARDGDMCYEPGNGRTIDFITAMAEVRTMAASTSTLLLSMCGSASGIFNIVLFPLMDINLAKAIHNILNSFLYLIFQIPSVTAQRCNNHGPRAVAGGSVLMCMPDLNPPINMLVAGVRSLGRMVDNWLDVSSIIAQRSLRLLSPKEAEALDCDATAKALSPASYSRKLFDATSVNRPKIVVGLTPGLYAVTDGKHAQYFNHYDSVESMAAPNVWPFEIDTRYGVAAVTYRGGSGSEDRDGLGDTSTTMLGCRCTDNAGMPPIRIQCALALKSAAAMAAAAAEAAASAGSNGGSTNYSSLIAAPDLTFDVVFHQRSTANYMTCAMTQIVVQSVRWPATRFSGSYASPRFVAGALSRGVVDATIWVSPLCTSRAAKFPEVCTPLFKAAACYPYCMAARMRGSGAGGKLVLYNAPDWHERVHLMQRDCVVDTPVLSNPLEAIARSAAAFLPNGTASSTNAAPDAETTLGTGDLMRGASVAAWTWEPNADGCVQSSTADTIVRRDVLPAYAATATPAARTFRSIRMREQPFAYAGDVTLTAVESGTGEHFVVVDRLYGNEINEYTMVKVRTNFPANPPADTVRKTEEIVEQIDRLPIPYAFSDMAGVQHPSVSTQTSVFLAVNPSLAMFKGFASGCYTGGQEWRMQLSALSSYAPIKIWRIDPFAYCPGDASGESETCGIGRVHHVEVEDAFTQIVPAGEKGNAEAYNVFDIRKCEVPFAVAVVNLEYINDENIAVTILKASFRDYSPDTGLLRPDAKNATYVVKFLSTTTMGMQDHPWDRESRVAATSAAEGTLCPAMRRLPNVGSMLAEAAVAAAEVVRKVLDIVLMLPAFVQMWTRGKTEGHCPLVTHGHSLMQRCGSDLLSLDDFFDALNRANAHYWRSFAIIAERVRDMGVDRIANIIDGVAYYGESTISPTTQYAAFVRSVKIPTKELGTQVMQGVMQVGSRWVDNRQERSGLPAQRHCIVHKCSPR